MATRFTFPIEQAFDANGDPLPGAKLYFYVTATSTPLDTYSDNGLTTPNTNPVEADSAGRFGAIFLSDADYKVILTDEDDVTIWTQDPVRGPAGASEATQNQVDARTASNVYVSPRRLADGLGLQGSSIASASALTLPDIGDYFTVTGTTAITSISTRRAGAEVTLLFSGACDITHNATSLILLSGLTYTTTAGDVLRFRSEGSGNWRQVAYNPALGSMTRRMAPASLSGIATSLSFPKGVTWIDLIVVSASLSGNTNLLVRLGDAGGAEGSGYIGASAAITGSSASSANPTGSFRTEAAASAAIYSGIIHLRILNPATFTWVCSGHLARSDTGAVELFAGAKALSEALTTVELASGDGASTFDSGTVAAIYG
jgi:hypothetical protein